MSAWRRAVGAGLVVVACAAVAGGAGAPGTSARKPYAEVFPEGEGRAIAERTCQICHSAMLVTQQVKDSTAWEKSLAQMAAWGAPPLTPAEHDTLRGYLVNRFGLRLGAGQ